MKRILIADDDYIITEMFKAFIEDEDLAEVVAVTHAYEDTVTNACKFIPDIAFIDINMDYKNAGIEASRFIKSKFPQIKIYLVTAYSRDVYEGEIDESFIDGYIDKVDFVTTVYELLKS